MSPRVPLCPSEEPQLLQELFFDELFASPVDLELFSGERSSDKLVAIVSLFSFT